MCRSRKHATCVKEQVRKREREAGDGLVFGCMPGGIFRRRRVELKFCVVREGLKEAWADNSLYQVSQIQAPSLLERQLVPLTTFLDVLRIL